MVKSAKSSGVKTDGQFKPMLRSVAFGVLSGLVIMGFLMATAAWMISNFSVPVTALNWIGMVCLLFGSLLSGGCSGILSGKRGLIIGGMTGVVWLLLLICGNLALYQMQFDLLTVIKMVGVFVCSTIGGMLGATLALKKEKNRYTYG